MTASSELAVAELGAPSELAQPAEPAVAGRNGGTGVGVMDSGRLRRHTEDPATQPGE
ncbi:hypothetical protein ACFPJ1_11805 [Kribbella qitaiheensis]|uniref:hypothetical protein n=1 Tax=Kribbella qitaiheensis TaxID=1544730 RepID=UPI00360726EE